MRKVTIKANNHSIHFQSGFSLIELMVTIAIIGVLAAVAIPSYNSYIKTSKLGVATENAETLAGLARAYYYEFETYPTGTYTPGSNTIASSTFDFNPDGDKDKWKYVMTTSGCTAPCVVITVTNIADTSISQTLTLQ